MKYIIMILIVVGMALADFITGVIKAYNQDDLSTSKLRKGGLNKVAEILVMSTACGLEFGIGLLGDYYDAEMFAEISGTAIAVVFLVYIIFMEFVSILKNYCVINPEAKWAQRLVKKLRDRDNEVSGDE